MDKKVKKHAYLSGGANVTSSVSSFISPLVEDVPYQTLHDGSRLYDYKSSQSFHDIMLNDVSVANLGIEEVRIWSNGYGYVLAQRPNEATEVYVMPDGTTLNYTLYGWVVLL